MNAGAVEIRRRRPAFQPHDQPLVLEHLDALAAGVLLQLAEGDARGLAVMAAVGEVERGPAAATVEEVELVDTHTGPRAFSPVTGMKTPRNGVVCWTSDITAVRTDL